MDTLEVERLMPLSSSIPSLHDHVCEVRVVMKADEQNPETPIPTQAAFWNQWNTESRESGLEKVSLEQAEVVVGWLEGLRRSDLGIIEVGCGSGWMCSQLTRFGHVTGTDLADDVLGRAAGRVPSARFISGDFMALDLGREAYDVVVSLEVLSHVGDQPAFVNKLATLLRPGGYLMLATQNRRALERNHIPSPVPGQLRRWVDHHELAILLGDDFEIEQLFSITPKFNRGVLRAVNSYKLNAALKAVGLGGVGKRVKTYQERAWLGWTLMALARKPGSA